ncbi:MAG: hypothetical protein KDA46_15115 [Parvularculaceae bacterium]|nr:hypothetical protein [Parvularculaceae bacterium]
MESVVFIGVLGVLGLVVFWYVGNEAAGRDGATGLFELGIDASGDAAPARRYRRKQRRARAGIAGASAAALSPGAPAQTYRRKPRRKSQGVLARD